MVTCVLFTQLGEGESAPTRRFEGIGADEHEALVDAKRQEFQAMFASITALLADDLVTNWSSPYEARI